MNPNYDIIVLAAGNGKRMKAHCNKMFLKIAGIPILYRTLKKIDDCKLIGRIVLVASPIEKEYCKEMIDSYGGIKKLEVVITGGNERSDSVKNALHYIYKYKKSDVILIHDGARPFITSPFIELIGSAANKTGSSLPVMKIAETVRKKENNQYHVIDRSQLVTAQTPQAITYQLINQCFLSKDAAALELTDDISYVEYFDHPVEHVDGEKWNIKVTTPDDIAWAECLLEAYPQLDIN